MSDSRQSKPASNPTVSAAQVLKDLQKTGRRLESQQTLALLEVLALGDQLVKQGKVRHISAVLARLRVRTTKE